MKRLDGVMKKVGEGSLRANMPTTLSIENQSNSECPICGGLGYVREDVPIDHPHFGKLFPCRCQEVEIARQRFEQLRALSNLDLFSHMTFDTFAPDGYDLPPDKAASLHLAFDRAQQYAANPDGWLVFLGSYGCGKTHLAAAIANEVIERGQAVLFVVVPDLLDHLRATYGPNSPVTYDQRFEEVRKAPLLILDDLGTESSTSWAEEKLFQICNFRYNARLPTIITSNHKLEEIDPRIRARLQDLNLSTISIIEAPDFRAPFADDGRPDLSSLFFLQDMTFKNFDLRQDELQAEQYASLRKAFEACQEYTEEPEGWLVLAGDYGSGKTHLAAAIANARTAMGHPALFIVVPDLLDHLRATYAPNSLVRYDERFQEICSTPLLILDDLGTQSSTPWAKEKLFQIFNRRYIARLPTVITMAQKIEEVEPRLRTRMLDRRLCDRYLIKVPSYRGTDRHKAGRKGRSRRRWNRE
jgi:DNA replication protein DnaC